MSQLVCNVYLYLYRRTFPQPFYKNHQANIKWPEGTSNNQYQRGAGLQKYPNQQPYKGHIMQPRLMEQHIQMNSRNPGVSQYFDLDTPCIACRSTRGAPHAVRDCPRYRDNNQYYYSETDSPKTPQYRNNQ